MSASALRMASSIAIIPTRPPAWPPGPTWRSGKEKYILRGAGGESMAAGSPFPLARTENARKEKNSIALARAPDYSLRGAREMRTPSGRVAGAVVSDPLSRRFAMKAAFKTLLGVALVLAVGLVASAEEKKKAGKVVTLKGELTCAKCGLKKADKCTNA